MFWSDFIRKTKTDNAQRNKQTNTNDQNHCLSIEWLPAEYKLNCSQWGMQSAGQGVCSEPLAWRSVWLWQDLSALHWGETPGPCQRYTKPAKPVSSLCVGGCAQGRETGCAREIQESCSLMLKEKRFQPFTSTALYCMCFMCLCSLAQYFSSVLILLHFHKEHKSQTNLSQL